MGAASPLLNNGGLSNSTAFRYGFTSLLYANGVIPTLRGEDTSGDFRDAPLMVSNHLSYLDGITLATMLNVPKIIAKTELLDLPVLGQFMKDIDCLFVDRDSSDSKKKIEREERNVILQRCIYSRQARPANSALLPRRLEPLQSRQKKGW
eukprot:GEMP01029118.1.p1 GENE.GEMP01029118.1~~GEMP01029118.1.p1  ORF type:complete len:150 (+),score=19.56 GEMP01029118.1:803-1252(+)